MPITDNKTVNGVLTIAGLAVGGVVAWKTVAAISDYQKNSKASSTVKYEQKQTVSGTNSYGKPTSVNLANTARDIYNALHVSWYESKDDDRAVRAVKNTPFLQLKNLETVYNKLYPGEDLIKDLAGMKDESYIQVKYLFR